MPIWPVSLPQTPLIGGLVEQPPDVLLETRMDIGPPKVRRRFSAGVRPLKITMLMTTTQVATLDAFFVTTLLGGALTFDMDDPRTESSNTYRMGIPNYEHRTFGLYIVTFDLKQQP